MFQTKYRLGQLAQNITPRKFISARRSRVRWSRTPGEWDGSNLAMCAACIRVSVLTLTERQA